MSDKRRTVYCDTNIFIRYLMGEDTQEGQQAFELLSQVQSGEVKAHLLESVFTEIVFVLTSFYRVPRDEIAFSLTGLIRYKGIVNDHKTVLVMALDYYQSTDLHIVDCLLAAHAHTHNYELFTFDKKLKKFMSKHEISQ